MYRILLAFVLATAFSAGARADFTAKDASGATISFKNSATCSSVVCVAAFNPVDNTGANFGVTGNPFFVSPASGATFPVVGPTAVGSAAANPPVLMGGTANAGATGTVQVAKVDSSGTQFMDCSAIGNTLCGLINSAIPAGTNTIGNVNGAPNVTPTDCSGTITTGGTAQTAIAAAATIHGFTIANIDASTGSGEPLWISFTTTAAASTAASYPIAAPTATSFVGYGSYSTPVGFGSNHAVSIVAATTGHKWSCTTW